MSANIPPPHTTSTHHHHLHLQHRRRRRLTSQSLPRFPLAAMSSNPYRLSLQSAGIHAGSSASAFKSSARHSYFCPLLRDKHTGSMFVYAVDAARTPLRSWWRGACEDARPDKWKKSPPSHRAEAPCCSTSTSTAAQRNNVLLRK